MYKTEVYGARFLCRRELRIVLQPHIHVRILDRIQRVGILVNISIDETRRQLSVVALQLKICISKPLLLSPFPDSMLKTIADTRVSVIQRLLNAHGSIGA